MNEISKISSVEKSLKIGLPVMKESNKNALIAISAIKKVETDEEDNNAQAVLVKIKATYQKIQDIRKGITDPIDKFKKELIEYEKPFDHKKGAADSEYNRVKKLRDSYANKKYEASERKRKEIELKNLYEQSKSQYVFDLETSISEGISNLILQGDKSMILFKGKMNLDNWDEMVKKLNYKPRLKKETFINFTEIVTVPDIKEGDKNECYQSLINRFGDFNAHYSAKALERLNKFKLSLPQYKEDLTAGRYEINEEKSIKLAEKLCLEEKAKDLEKIAGEKDDKIISSEFASQVSIQEIKNLEGVRKTDYVRLENEEGLKLAETISRVVIHCLSDPSFDGLFKKNKDGTIKKDSQGNGDYCDGVSFWLKHLAKSKESISIPGVNISKIISTIQSSK